MSWKLSCQALHFTLYVRQWWPGAVRCPFQWLRMKNSSLGCVLLQSHRWSGKQRAPRLVGMSWGLGVIRDSRVIAIVVSYPPVQNLFEVFRLEGIRRANGQHRAPRCCCITYGTAGGRARKSRCASAPLRPRPSEWSPLTIMATSVRWVHQRVLAPGSIVSSRMVKETAPCSFVTSGRSLVKSPVDTRRCVLWSIIGIGRVLSPLVPHMLFYGDVGFHYGAKIFAHVVKAWGLRLHSTHLVRGP
jgi:hypothetical protein